VRLSVAVAENAAIGGHHMARRWLRWMWLHWKLSLFLVLTTLFAVLNILAYNHAHAMMHFQEGGSRTAVPESLSVWEKAQVLVFGVRIPKPTNQADPGSLGLTFETRRFEGADGGTLEAWCIPHSGAQGLALLLHGYASSKASLLPEAKAFHDLGYAVVLLDLRGSGGSDGNETTIGMYEADDVALVVKSLKASHPNQALILYGQSMGSAAILRAVAENGVQAKAVIVECPFDRLISTVENRFAAMGLPSFPCADLLVFWGGVQQGFNGFRHNPVDYARSVHCPVLLMHGASDPRVTTKQAEAIFENLPGEKRFELFPEVGHRPYIAAMPDLWKRTVAQFLEKHGM
jgi:dipeptidyl aminopeptidase/acylaminoacyl peptidase